MKSDRQLVSLILAAGQGTRMKSDLAKVLHRVCGSPMVKHVVAAARKTGPERIILVVGHQAEAVIEEMSGDGLEFVVQKKRLGTGHAVMEARSALDGFEGTIMVLTGDTPLLRGETLSELLCHHRTSEAVATVLSAVLDDATGYGRIIRDGEGGLLKIVEHKDASEEERSVREINSGIFCFESEVLFPALDRIGRENVQGEYYLTDVMGILRGDGRKTAVYLCDRNQELLGINTVDQLKEAERLMIENG